MERRGEGVCHCTVKTWVTLYLQYIGNTFWLKVPQKYIKFTDLLHVIVKHDYWGQTVLIPDPVPRVVHHKNRH